MAKKKKIFVVGAGRWGSFIAWYLNKIGHEVMLYGKEDSPHLHEFIETGTNGLVTFDGSVSFVTDITLVKKNDIVIISIGSQQLRGCLSELVDGGIGDIPIVLCMKGIECNTGKRLTEIVTEVLGEHPTAVWLGPGHVQNFVSGVPNCMVIDSVDEKLKFALVEDFSSSLIRFYYGTDLLGNEIGAATKNVIGIAAGILDGLEVPSLKGTLMSRGTREISRLIKKMGGNELSAYGLCHLGDYEATVFSKYSHNRQFGESLVKHEQYTSLAEGYYTAAALRILSEKYGEELPICTAVYSALYEGAEPKDAVEKLFLRGLKTETYM